MLISRARSRNYVLWNEVYNSKEREDPLILSYVHTFPSITTSPSEEPARGSTHMAYLAAQLTFECKCST